MYSYNLTVKKTGSSEWTIYSEKGNELHVLTGCNSADMALTNARAWASSWSSVNVRIEDDKNKKRD